MGVKKMECEVCGVAHDRYNAYSGEDAKYCSDACKQKAYRERKKVLLYDHSVTEKEKN